MNVFVTSDTHFNHYNMACDDGAFGESSRHFSSVQEMNKKIIENWNSVVRPEDIVYHLGDVSFGKLSELSDIIKQLNGHVILIRGNHDSKKTCRIVEEAGWAVVFRQIIEHDGIIFDMKHIPSQDFVGSENLVQLYGHLHDAAPIGLQKNYSYHVGLDTNGLMPVNLDDIVKDVREGYFGNH